MLLDLDGAPNFQPLPNTALLYATNTDDDLFLDVASQDHYLLASGRWFATRTLKTGPWRFVPADQLPAEFAKNPRRVRQGWRIGTRSRNGRCERSRA